MVFNGHETFTVTPGGYTTAGSKYENHLDVVGIVTFIHVTLEAMTGLTRMLLPKKYE